MRVRVPPEKLRCNLCKKTKPFTSDFFLEYFQRGKIRLRHTCLDCLKAQGRAWYEANKERHKANGRRWIDSNRERWQELQRAAGKRRRSDPKFREEDNARQRERRRDPVKAARMRETSRLSKLRCCPCGEKKHEDARACDRCLFLDGATASQTAVIQALRDDSATSDQLCTQTSMAYRTVRRALQELIVTGRVSEEMVETKGAARAIYRLEIMPLGAGSRWEGTATAPRGTPPAPAPPASQVPARRRR